MNEVNQPAAGTEIHPQTPQTPPAPPTSPTEVYNPPAGQTPPETTKTPKNMKKAWIILLAVLLVAGGAAAYWFVIRKDNKTSNTTQNAKKDIPLLRYGPAEGQMNTFYPESIENDVTNYVNKQMFEGLVGWQDKTKIVPVLAESWTNPDDNTWLVTLKSNVKFHTGNTLTSKDVVYSYNQIKSDDRYADVVSTVKSVEAVGDSQVKITTASPDPILLNRLTSLLIVDSTAAGKKDPKYGTGPYQLKTGTTPDEDHLDLVAFDGYHGGHVYTREVQFSVYREAEGSEAGSAEKRALEDMKAGKLDIFGFVTGDRVTQAKTDNLQLFPVDDASVYYLLLNTQKKGSPLANQKVRQAIYEATDVNGLLKAIGRTGTAASQLVPQFIPGYNPSITRPKYDVAAAKELLKQAGYPNGVSLNFTIYSGAKEVGQELVKQLATAGITATLTVRSDVDAIISDVNAGKMEVFYQAEGSILGDASDVFAYELQSPYYKNADLDKLISQANTTFKQDERLKLLQQISKKAMDDTAIVPLFNQQATWVANKPYVMTQDILTSDLGVYFYKVYTN